MIETIKVPFARPFIGAEEEEAALRVLRSGWLTTGNEAAAFESEFAAFINQKAPKTLKALAVNSATSGLHLALEACGVGKGDVVITTPYTFTSTAEVVRYLGAEVAFADVEADSYLMDPKRVALILERLAAGLPAYEARPGVRGKGFGPVGKPKAIIPVHFGGLVCPMSVIRELGANYKCKVIEDAAHAFPALSEYPETPYYAGTLGDIGVFSFYATKTITSGEGGMIVCADEHAASRMAVMRCHGFDRSAWDRYTGIRASWRYSVVAPGFKYNLPDLLAAVGRVQLQRSNNLLHRRRDIAKRYDEAFGLDERFIIPPSGDGDARHLYVLRLAASEKRDAFIERLKDMGVGSSVHFIPLHHMPYYRERYGLRENDFPQANARFKTSVSLPIWPGMTTDHIDRVIFAVRKSADTLAADQ